MQSGNLPQSLRIGCLYLDFSGRFSHVLTCVCMVMLVIIQFAVHNTIRRHLPCTSSANHKLALICHAYNNIMHSFRSKAQVHIRADRKHSAVRATIAPSRPQQATAKKAPSVNARVQYVQPPPKSEELFTYVYEKPENVDRISNLEHVDTEVPFTDLRTIEDQSGEFTLERNGFQLEELHVPSDIDWDDDDDVSSLCNPRRSPASSAPTIYPHILLFEHCHLLQYRPYHSIHTRQLTNEAHAGQGQIPP